MKFVIATLAATYVTANSVDLGSVDLSAASDLASGAAADLAAAAKLITDCKAFVDQAIAFLSKNKGKYVKSTGIASWEGKASCDRTCGETFDFGPIPYPTGTIPNVGECG